MPGAKKKPTTANVQQLFNDALYPGPEFANIRATLMNFNENICVVQTLLREGGYEKTINRHNVARRIMLVMHGKLFAQCRAIEEEHRWLTQYETDVATVQALAASYWHCVKEIVMRNEGRSVGLVLGFLVPGLIFLFLGLLQPLLLGMVVIGSIFLSVALVFAAVQTPTILMEARQLHTEMQDGTVQTEASELVTTTANKYQALMTALKETYDIKSATVGEVPDKPQENFNPTFAEPNSTGDNATERLSAACN